MRRFWLACMLLQAAIGFAEAPQALVKALTGSTKPYTGVQATRAASDSGFAEAKVVVYGNGKSNTRREYSLPDGQKLATVHTKGATYQQFGADWIMAAAEHTWKPTEQASMIASNYRVSVSNILFLGRKSNLVSITPKQSYNPIRKITVDSSTGLILKDELFAPDGRLRSSSWFLSIQFKDVPEGLFKISRVVTGQSEIGPTSFTIRKTAAEVEKMTGSAIPKPRYVPEGYKPILVGTMLTGSSRLMPAVRYSDGLSTFTVFERGKGRNGRRRGWGGGQQLHDDLHSDVQRSVVFVNGQRSYVLIGDLAESELRKIARSL